MMAAGPALIFKYTPIGLAAALTFGAILQSVGIAEIDWGLIIEKIPEVAMVLVVVWYSLSLNQQNRDFIEKMETRHTAAMKDIAVELGSLAKTITQHDARMEQYIRDGRR